MKDISFITDQIVIWTPIVISIASLILSIISMYKSSKTQKIQDEILKYDLKIKENEYQRIEEQKKKADETQVEARIINMGQGDYRLKVWNSGNKKVFNVIAELDEKSRVSIIDDKMPFEELDVSKNFELRLAVNLSSLHKFAVTTEWDDETGEHFSKRQFLDF